MQPLAASAAIPDAPPRVASLAEAVRAAALLARPFALVHPLRRALGPLAPAEMEALRREPAFRRPLERALLASLGLDRFDLGAEAIAALCAEPSGRLALALVAEPLPRVEAVAQSVAAAVLQRHVLRAAAKPQRQHLRAALGTDAYVMATQEAPTLFPGLAALGSDAAFEAILAAPGPEEGRRRLAGFGLSLLLRFVETAEPRLAPLMASRLPPGEPAAAAPAAPFVPHVQALTRFIRRRHPAWSATTG